VHDADSILQRDSLLRIVQPFLDDPSTVACGGTVRLANGCSAIEGVLDRVGIPKNVLAIMQVIEYLRAFLFGRLGWSRMAGSSSSRSVRAVSQGDRPRSRRLSDARARRGPGPDAAPASPSHDLRRPYRVAQVPDPVCWTEGPEDLRSLASQRIRCIEVSRNRCGSSGA